MQAVVLPEAPSAPTWAFCSPLHRLWRGTSDPLKHGIPRRSLPDLQDTQVGVETIGLTFGAACVFAAMYSARRNFSQRHRRSIRWVARAQQASETLPPGGGFEGGRKKPWERIGQVIQEPGKRLLQWRNRDSDDEATIEELVRLIAKQRALNKDFIDQVDKFTSPRSAQIEQLRKDVERVESRHAALHARLKQAQESKQGLDQQAQVLVKEIDALLQEEAELEPAIKEQLAVLQSTFGVLKRLKQTKEDDDAVCEGTQSLQSDVKKPALEETLEAEPVRFMQQTASTP